MFFSKRHNFLARFLLISGLALATAPVFSESADGRDLETNSIFSAEKLLSEELKSIHQEEVDLVLAEGISYSEEERLSDFPDIDSVLLKSGAKKIASSTSRPKEKKETSQIIFSKQSETIQGSSWEERRSLEIVSQSELLFQCGSDLFSQQKNSAENLGKNDKNFSSSPKASVRQPSMFSGTGLSSGRIMFVCLSGSESGLISKIAQLVGQQCQAPSSLVKPAATMVGTPRRVATHLEQQTRGEILGRPFGDTTLGNNNSVGLQILPEYLRQGSRFRTKPYTVGSQLGGENSRLRVQYSAREKGPVSLSYIFLSFPEPIKI